MDFDVSTGAAKEITEKIFLHLAHARLVWAELP